MKLLAKMDGCPDPGDAKASPGLSSVGPLKL
jgi:hypothetical protein